MNELGKQAERFAKQGESETQISPKRILDDPDVQESIDDLVNSDEKTASFGAANRLKSALVKQARRIQSRTREETKRRVMKEARSNVPENILDKLKKAFNKLIQDEQH
jgi:hypothetical protein